MQNNILRMYVLVVKTSEDSWHAMNISQRVIYQMYLKDPEYYRVERWHYRRLETGDVLFKKEGVVYGS